MLAALYARVSTMRQENEETIENQIMAIKDFAKEKGLTIVKQYLDDGWSGTILVRPALDELRIDAKKQIWDVAVIYDPDRLSRKYSYQELVIDELTEARIQVLFVTTPPPEDDSDRLLYGVKGIFAEYERAKIVERFRLGKLRKARDGHIVIGQPPYGYDYVPRQGDTQAHFVINEQEATVVKMIFSWVVEDRLTMREIVKKLQALGIQPKRSKKGVWNTSTLTHLLRNEAYIGTVIFNKSVAVVPQKPLNNEKYKRYKKTSRRFKPENEWVRIPITPILDKALFERARKQLKLNFETCDRNKKNEYLLGGQIYCICGKRRTGEGPQHGKHLYYRCSERVYSFPLPSKCKVKGVNARIADKLVWNGLVDFMSSPVLINQQIQRWQKKRQLKSDTSFDNVDQLQREIEKIKKEESRYIKAYGAEVITLEQFQETMTELRGKREVLENQIGHFESQKLDDVILPTSEQIKIFSQRAKKKLTSLRFDAQKAIMLKVVDTIIADQESLRVRGALYLSIQEEQNVKSHSKGRYCWFAKCGEVDAF